MKTNDFSLKLLENNLRRAAPPLGCADAARIARACARVEELRTNPVSLRFHAFVKPLLRIAAVLVLLGSVFVLLKKPVQGPVYDPLCTASAPRFDPLNTLVDPHAVTDVLANESANLVSDLATLTTVLNERTLAILF